MRYDFDIKHHALKAEKEWGKKGLTLIQGDDRHHFGTHPDLQKFFSVYLCINMVKLFVKLIMNLSKSRSLLV